MFEKWSMMDKTPEERKAIIESLSDTFIGRVRPLIPCEIMIEKSSMSDDELTRMLRLAFIRSGEPIIPQTPEEVSAFEEWVEERERKRQTAPDRTYTIHDLQKGIERRCIESAPALLGAVLHVVEAYDYHGDCLRNEGLQMCRDALAKAGVKPRTQEDSQ